MDTFLWIGAGGFLGANARYVMTLAVNSLTVPRWGLFPFGTIAVNVLGSFGLALFGVWFASRVGLSPNIKLLIGTGFFGAFTTFSTFANESLALYEAEGVVPFVSNVLFTNGLCLVGVVIGLGVAHRLFGGG